MSPDEVLTALTEKVIRLTRECVGEWPHFFAFDVPETNHEARLSVSRERRFRREDNWRLSVGVKENGSSRLHSHFLCHGEGQAGKDQILAYLERPEFHEEFISSVRELSRHVDQDD